jgi:uncharacterized protein (DUF1499 family)
MTHAAAGNARRPNRRGIVLVLALSLVLSFVVARGVVMLFSPRPKVGLVDGRLRPCPTSPNCVCSQTPDATHAIEPLRFDGPAQSAWKRLRDVLMQQPRTAIITRDDHYLHAEFRSFIMRYVDDVEFVLDEAQSVIHVRSASRIGYSDLGANRKRVEAIRRLFTTALQTPPAHGQATLPAE